MASVRYYHPTGFCESLPQESVVTMHVSGLEPALDIDVL